MLLFATAITDTFTDTNTINFESSNCVIKNLNGKAGSLELGSRPKKTFQGLPVRLGSVYFAVILLLKISEDASPPKCQFVEFEMICPFAGG